MTSRRPSTDSEMLGYFPMRREASDESLKGPGGDYLNRNSPDILSDRYAAKPGSRSPASAPARKSPDYTVREHRLVIAIDYGTTFTGQ